MNEQVNLQELELLRQKFDAAGQPALPSSLHSQALFARMDSGLLCDPKPVEIAAVPSGTSSVLLWRRWGSVAAALLLAVGLFAAGRSGLFDEGLFSSAGRSEKSAAMPESAPESESPKVNANSSVTSGEGGSAADDNAMMFAAAPFASPRFSGEDADTVLALLQRQQWEPAAEEENVAYLFSLAGADYGFSSESCLVWDFTSKLSAKLSDADCAELLSLCEASL